MKDSGRLLWMSVGIVFGVIGAGLFWGRSNPALAYNDRYEDYVMCTGAATMVRGAMLDGVWLLDYRSGKLLGTMVNRATGRLVGWSEVDLLSEFGVAPRQNVHFLMTTGGLAPGQSGLYIAETTTGRLGVYSMASRADGDTGVIIRRHDMGPFRQPQQ